MSYPFIYYSTSKSDSDLKNLNDLPLYEMAKSLSADPTLTLKNIKKEQHSHAILLSNLPDDIDLQELNSLFSSYSLSRPIHIFQPKKAGQKTKAIFHLKSMQDVQEIINKYNGFCLRGSIISAKFTPVFKNHRTKSFAMASLSISISNIPFSISLSDVLKLFNRYGDIEKYETKHKQGSKTWQCIIQYDSFSAASSSIIAMNGQCLLTSTDPITVQFVSYDDFSMDSKVLNIKTQNHYWSIN